MTGAHLSPSDEDFMRLALRLAQRGRGFVEPNPMVGCVIVRDGNVIGQGYHQTHGGPHAEIHALRSIHHADHARGSTAYVTLEPCCHDGKTPPCTVDLIAAGVTRVVAAMRDPFRKVDGGGIRQLNEAGIETSVGLLEKESAKLNAPYLKRVQKQRPWVIAKWAMTIDGKIATVRGDSKWISSESSRCDVHRLRSRVDAIVTAMGTVVADDPTLIARNVDPMARVATRVVLCRHTLPSVHSNLVKTIDQAALLIAAGPLIAADGIELLREYGAEVIRLPEDQPLAMVEGLLETLYERGATNVMLEGGGEMLASFAEVGQLDELHVFVGPSIFGGTDAPGPIGGRGAERVADAMRLELETIERFEDDVKLIYRAKSSGNHPT